MTLTELIRYLEKQPLSKVVKYGFGKARSYRGNYEEVAFEPKQDVDVHFMLLHAKLALNSSLHGYKGGLFKITGDTVVNIAHHGCCNGDDDELTTERLESMLED